MIRCAICSEPIVQGPRDIDWTHAHGDVYCGTGDGATALPPAEYIDLDSHYKRKETT